MEWVTSTVRVARRESIPSSVSWSDSRVRASSAEKGSSMMSTSGSRTNARASDTRRRCPPERRPGNLPASVSRPRDTSIARAQRSRISNGIKYNREQGSLAISIADAGSFWEISITDTGIGMSEGEIANLFQEFYRVKSAKTSGIAGTGLDLHGELP